MIENSNHETNFPHKLFLTDTQVSKICKAFANGLSANITFSKNQLSKIVRSGEILGELLVASPYTALKVETQELIKRAPELTKDATRYFVNKEINRLKKDFTSSEGSRITLTNNKVKNIIKVIKSLENKGVLLRGNTRKITGHKGGCLNSLKPLMTAGLPLMKSVLTPLAKSVL